MKRDILTDFHGMQFTYDMDHVFHIIIYVNNA